MSQAGAYITTSGPGSAVQTLTGNSGGAISPTAGNINVVGTGGVTVTGNPGTSTLTISSSGSNFPWTVVTAGNQALAPFNGYISNNNAGVLFTLPATAAVGTIFRVTGINAGGWGVDQNAGQTIYIGNDSTTTGITGFIASTADRDSVEIVCVVANTDFNVISVIGNLQVN